MARYNSDGFYKICVIPNNSLYEPDVYRAKPVELVIAGNTLFTFVHFLYATIIYRVNTKHFRRKEFIMGAPVIHFEILGKDGKKLQDFYSKLFDWKIDSNNPMNYGLVQKEDGGIGGGVGPTQEGQSGYVTVYIEVPDTDEHLKKAEALGGKIVMPTTTIPNMVTFALFTDPEGNLVGLVKSETA
jgi:uncharacterized protein